MTKSEFYVLLDELLENDPGTIKGNETLESLPRWDSLAIIGFIALLDQHFSINLPATRIMKCKTIDDLSALLGDRLVG